MSTVKKLACLFCRRQKIRCDESDHPLGCLSCRKRKQTCEHVQSRKRKSQALTRPIDTRGLPALQHISTLLREYFEQDEIVHTVHPETFIRQLDSGQAPRSLLFALLATVAERFVPAPNKKVARKVLKDRARMEMMRDEQPTIQNVQTLMLLAMLMLDDEASLMSNVMTAGMGLRMLVVLKVHRLDDTLVEQHPSIAGLDEPQKETIRRLFWYLYITDRAHSIHGNPFTIADEDICLRLFNEEEAWRWGRVKTTMPLFDPENVHDNHMWIMGDVHGKAYFFQCKLRLASLLGKVKTYVEAFRRLGNMPEGSWKEGKQRRLERQHRYLLDCVQTWWATFPLFFTDLGNIQSKVLPVGHYNDADWTITTHIFYYWIALELNVDASPYQVNLLEHLELFKDALGVVDVAMVHCKRPQMPCSVVVVSLVAHAYGALLHQHPHHTSHREWRHAIEKCYLFLTMCCGDNTLTQATSTSVKELLL